MSIGPPLGVLPIERGRLAGLQTDAHLGLAGAQREDREVPGQWPEGRDEWRIGRPFGILRELAVVLHERACDVPNRLHQLISDIPLKITSPLDASCVSSAGANSG